MLLKASTKSNANCIAIAFSVRMSANYRYHDSWESNNFRKEAIKEEGRTDTKKAGKGIKSDNFSMRNKEKSNIAIAIFEKLII